MPLLVSELPSDAVFVDAAAGFSQSFVLTSKYNPLLDHQHITITIRTITKLTINITIIKEC